MTRSQFKLNIAYNITQYVNISNWYIKIKRCGLITNETIIHQSSMKKIKPIVCNRTTYNNDETSYHRYIFDYKGPDRPEKYEKFQMKIKRPISK